MTIQYDIVVTIINLVNNQTKKFTKTFEHDITATTDTLLYNNYHVISNDVYVLDIFSDEVTEYCKQCSIQLSSIEVDEFEIVSPTDKVDVFFESSDDTDNSLSLRPSIKAYVHPKYDELKAPNLIGVAYDETTIIWTWPDDEEYAHYLVEDIEPDDPTKEESSQRIVAQLPIGAKNYIESNLSPDTAYTRRLVNYTSEQTSVPSSSVTVRTETVTPVQSLESYSIKKNYDFTTTDLEREQVSENLEAFHSGVGDFNDLKVYKQMDADFYQKFKAYFELSGRRFQREKRYEQIGFNYKLCLEAVEEIEEQEGEVTFDVEAYPREWISIEDYMWSTVPILVQTKVKATIFLRKDVPEEEVIEETLHRPKITPVTREETSFNDTTLIISLDCSTSQRAEATENRTRRDEMVASAKNTIDFFEQKAPNSIEYIIVGWAGDASGKKFSPGQASAAKAYIDTIHIEHKISTIGSEKTNLIATKNATNFELGVTYYKKLNPSQTNRIAQILYTDGFANTWIGAEGLVYGNLPNPPTPSFSEERATKLLESLYKGLDEANCKTYIILGARPDQMDPDLTTVFVDKTRAEANKAFQQQIKDRFVDAEKAKQHNVFAVKQLSSISESELTDALCNSIQMFSTSEVFDHNEFNGWEEYTVPSPPIGKYNLDYVRAVDIESDIYDFYFLHSSSEVSQIPSQKRYGITPVVYDREEKRAVLPKTSFLEPTSITTKNLYNIILDKAKQTDAWKEGYNKTIGTIEKSGESDKFLITNLFIYDTYRFADEDVIDDGAKFFMSDYEYGMEGSVNTFATLDKINTKYYGGDNDGSPCYLVANDNSSMLQIQGYTDAIIYDYMSYAREELNAYDRPQAVISGPSVEQRHMMVNRKKPSLTFSSAGGETPVSHCIDLVEKDKDIWAEPYKLDRPGGYIIIQPMTKDLVVHNDRWYTSPVLNYRFNLEDPNAKTPIKEILPDCDPDNRYLHVVLLHVYYAKNVWITNTNNYHGSPQSWMNIIAYKGDQCLGIEGTDSQGRHILTQGLYQWSKKEWQHRTDNGWYIDNYVWFMAKKMTKLQDYYDELPGPGFDTFYGLVNGRYKSNNINGKDDLTVDTPQFNIPSTVTDKHADSVKIYCVITETSPKTGLVSYKWEHPMTNFDAITQVNGDYIYFSSDSMAWKDIEYIDVISTINFENQELFNSKTVEKIFSVQKPNTVYDYQNYYLKVVTDNSDVLPMKYPTEVVFDENDSAEVGVSFKGVVNATSKWSPRIHNGYYYLNQHEYHAYCEFDAEADYDTCEEVNYKKINGYICIDVHLRKPADPPEHYSINKNSRSELLQDESSFIWVNNRGLTLKPIVDGEYYKEYRVTEYYSPKITFDNVLTKAEALTVHFDFDDVPSAGVYVPMEIRAYDVNAMEWTDWKPFSNGSTPPMLSSAYQLRFQLEASTYNSNKFIEDYCCCYLDWKNDGDENNLTNIVTITDHMTTGPFDAPGTFISKIFDYGTDTTQVALDIFESKYDGKTCRLLVGYANTREALLLENISWIDITSNRGHDYLTGRFFRYKIEVPAGQKVYWLHKKINTLESHVSLPYITGITMKGSYQPSDTVTNFINTEAFELVKDGNYHVIFPSVMSIIGSDVLQKGFTYNHIESVSISCSTANINIQYDNGINNSYPSTSSLNNPIEAQTNVDMSIVIKNTPFIRVDEKPYIDDDNEDLDIITIRNATPQQFCPITIEDENGEPYIQLFDCDKRLHRNDYYTMKEPEKYIHLYRNDYELGTVNVYINNALVSSTDYVIQNHLLIFNNFLNTGDVVWVEYRIKHSFYAIIDRIADTTTLYIYTDQNTCKINNGANVPVELRRKYKVYFETSKRNNKFVAEELSLNPIYRTDYKGFIYLTDEHNDVYHVKMYCNPLRIRAGGYDKVDVQVEVLDIQDNPVISKKVSVTCDYGIIDCDNYVTDMNGVIHFIYESSVLPSIDNIRASVISDSGVVIGDSVSIINE